MGYKVVIRNIETSEQRFLSGHTNNVSALCVSPCGKYVASGQNNHLGFKATVIVWNYEEGTMMGSYETHKVGVEDLCFTCNGDFLVSLGGRDDGNVIVWDVQKNSLICGSFASNDTSGDAYNVTRMHLHGGCFVTAGDRTLKIWRIEAEKRRVHGIDVEVGKLKRLVNCIVVDEKDEIVYCGTSSGDIINARLNLRDDLECGDSPARSPVMIGCYSKITRDLRKMKTGEGDLYAGGVTSLLLLKDGKLLVAWNDGTIRAFASHNGQLHFAIHNAHTKAVSTVAVTNDGVTLISGGCDGQVRIWEIKADVQRLISILKEHRGPITSLHISSNNENLISSSTDGTCVVWDVTRRARKHTLMGNTMFMMAQFTPDGIQILTCGTDRKIAYWETLDGSLVREIEGSNVGTLNCVDISPDGRCFVIGSNDCTVKIWEYDSADLLHIGTSHAAIITGCKFSADGKYIVTTSADGAIIIWKYPSETSEDSKSTSQTRRTVVIESSYQLFLIGVKDLKRKFTRKRYPFANVHH
ncbi:wd repeat-containing protein 16 [Lasius niger]|uniref:Cilia- and flagella-associated protein 52 n=1 Tax=Lasius niger TaxID=67767 RepID=A0A0J7NNK8_LASNI|nr:wd repeat-containing protein 16 [Lasius niger]